jgi:hypothetical protein
MGAGMKLTAPCLAMSATSSAFADRFGINEAYGSPGSMGAYWVIVAVVATYFLYRSVKHNEPFEILAVALLSALLSMAFGILNFTWVVLTK